MIDYRVTSLPGRIASIESKKRRALARGWLSHRPRPSNKDTKLYRMWVCLRARCCNHKAARAEYYVGKGIRVCEEWQNSFAVFRAWACAQMRGYVGDRRKASIDRINSDLGYSPGNCQIIPLSENSRRSSRNMAKSVAKLTAKDVDEMKRAYASGVSGPKLAKRYRVSHGSVYRAVKLPRTWA